MISNIDPPLPDPSRRAIYRPDDWYWIVGGDTSRLWSSARAMYVPADDAQYLAWASDPTTRTSKIDTEDNLIDVLLRAYPSGSPVRAWTPRDIVAAIKAIDPAKAAAILANTDEITKAEFFTARLVRENDTRLTGALWAVGISIEALAAQIKGALNG